MPRIKIPSFRRARIGRGFTLIELVVVVAVLAILAGIVLPKLDIFKLKANKATAAANMAGINQYVEAYRTQKDNYPDNWDSLMDEQNPTSLFSGLDPQLLGPVSGVPASPQKLATTTIADQNELRSLNRVGIINTYNHVGGGFPGDSASAKHQLSQGDTVATLNTADEDAKKIVAALYPKLNPLPGTANIPPGRKLVVFGLGPRNQLCDNTDASATLHGAPFYANTDQLKYYNRFLVIFEIFSNGSRCRMLATVGADADQLSEEIQDFYEN
ncbi:MAG: prepilin-type N-terminal cleavage/methylation domain-containing protein [Planctomycetes bacterium]|nr:prepilin-type N-terminal cleavage/methylation domain-containing protein [Planctomycetota bacterium]